MDDYNYGYLSPGFPENTKYKITTYDERTLIDVITQIGDADYINNHSINWDKLIYNAEKSITKQLYTFSNDSQRKGYLKDYFNELLWGIPSLQIEIAHNSWGKIVKDSEWKSYMDNADANFHYASVMKDYAHLYFAMDCCRTVNTLVTSISETCLDYDGLDFDNIIVNSIIPITREASSLFWWIKGGGAHGGGADDGPYIPKISPEATNPVEPKAVKAPWINNEPKNLFRDDSMTKKYVDLLKNKKPAVLNQSGEFIRGVNSKSKAVIVAWFDALSKKGKINIQLTTDEERALAINKLIPNLEITARSMTGMSASYNKNLSYFSDLIEQI